MIYVICQVQICIQIESYFQKLASLYNYIHVYFIQYKYIVRVLIAVQYIIVALKFHTIITMYLRSTDSDSELERNVYLVIFLEIQSDSYISTRTMYMYNALQCNSHCQYNLYIVHWNVPYNVTWSWNCNITTNLKYKLYNLYCCSDLQHFSTVTWSRDATRYL